MSFNPILFINVAKDLNSRASTEESYRSAVSRAYYGAFGYLKDRLDLADYGPSCHQNLIDNFKNAGDKNSKIVGKKLEALFERRKHADYKYRDEFTDHNCQYCIQEAEKIIELFNNLDKNT
jgi:uncharacterized protein (UPF0332 family)